MRAYEWTLQNATLEQVLAAIETAKDLIAADDRVLPDCLVNTTPIETPSAAATFAG